MRISYFILIISFIFDTIILNNVNFTINSIHMFPMCTLSGLICSYFYSSSDNKFIILSGLCGLLIDIVWTNTIIIYTIIYLFIGFMIIFFNKLFAINIFNYLVEVIMIIFIENITVYCILLIINAIDLEVYMLFIKILKSIPLTLAYSILLYVSLNLVGRKKNWKKRY